MRKQQIPASLRWTALLIASLAMFGNYYLYDSVAYVGKELMDELGFSNEDFSRLYSVYSVAAVVVLTFSGLLINRFGARVVILVAGVICAVSGFVTAATDQLTVMLVGRFLLGFSAEPLIVAITVVLAKWFRGRELGFALGVNLFIARAGSYAADWSPTWAKAIYAQGWHQALVLAGMIGLLCGIGGVVYFVLEKRASKNYVLGAGQEPDRLNLRESFQFTPSFWFVVILCMTFYSAIFPFRGFAPTFFVNAHGVSGELAGQLNSMVIVASMLATPFIGLLVDKIGHRALMMFIGSVIILPVFLLLIYADINLFIPVTMLGVATSLVPAVMWPSVAYIVEEKKLGTAYALMTLIQQIGVAGFVWLVGKANDLSAASAANPTGYHAGMWIFSTLGIVGLVFSFLLYKTETGPRGHGLEKPSAKAAPVISPDKKDDR
ncbi:MFS transporter [Mangrovibacterium sp.]|uniref:MFS transporter n=1 Tax=Mangrovibacterium sp. TaxID=1961364 RepID=UPI003562E2D1